MEVARDTTKEICGERKPGGIDVICMLEPDHLTPEDQWHAGEVHFEESHTIISPEFSVHKTTMFRIERVEWKDSHVSFKRAMKRLGEGVKDAEGEEG